MKKSMLILIMFMLVLLCIYSAIDIGKSLWYTLAYESMNTFVVSTILGKLLFLILALSVFVIVFKRYKR